MLRARGVRFASRVEIGNRDSCAGDAAIVARLMRFATEGNRVNTLSATRLSVGRRLIESFTCASNTLIFSLVFDFTVLGN